MVSTQSPLRKRLESLECHFTWSLDGSERRSARIVLHRLENVRDQGECAWKGHLYNLLGYYYHIRGSTEEALAHLREAEAIIREQEAEGRGPRLLINQANLAWVHYLLGELPECEAYLEEVAKLKEDFPAPPGCDLHPEVYGEKGWTQIKLDLDMKKEAIANFERAVRGDPNRKEWHVGLALAMYRVHFDDDEFKEDIVKLINTAKTMDPDNLRMSALYLCALAGVGRKTEETVREAHDLIHQLKPDLDALGDILHFLRLHDSLDSALRAAEEVVRKHPFEPKAKKQLALCYKWKVFNNWENCDLSEVTKGVDIYEKVIMLYPYYWRGKIDLASIHAKAGNVAKADKIYADLLDRPEDLEPEELQLIYQRYGTYLKYVKRDFSKSIDYHKKAAEITVSSKERNKSLQILRSILTRGKGPRCDEIYRFLSNIDLS